MSYILVERDEAAGIIASTKPTLLRSAEHVMWGSDFSRPLLHHTYAEALCYMQKTNELSDVEKEFLPDGIVCGS